MEMREVISTGNDLAAIAAVDAGCRFFGGYVITSYSIHYTKLYEKQL